MKVEDEVLALTHDLEEQEQQNDDLCRVKQSLEEELKAVQVISP